MLEDLGWDDARATAWDADPLSLSGAQPGRVVRAERTAARVALADDVVTVPVSGLAVGDWVATDGATWASVLPRRTTLARQAAGTTSDEQVLAANVDAVIVVEPADPEPNVRRVERMLTLAWSSGAAPVVVLTKNDLATRDLVPDVAAVALGVDVVATSSLTGENLDAVRRLLGPGRTFVLVGPSGAGKSSLVNALAGREVLATGDVRGDGRGRHTTTHRELVVVEDLGCLVDTPGVREVAMTGDADGLEAAFADVVELAATCRFADCEHRTEPGCSINAAIDDGTLDAARLGAFQKLEREIAYQARRRGEVAAYTARTERRARVARIREAMAVKGRPRGL
ncbi:ribosome small subunit-dependent GTPase A [Sanguibacter sp. HDW7]|uniref:ribosome small subunit-dependent GTPase A n=1 Tax=Sanguibacter sp. HDW7 TaxID=2714931 RepID=UPI00140E88CB|nr:ribosome small subunit-dependent GTPase A [Sanguibacter sp. HDW7]QIK84693.1 ribosome small subunit-dependent GTPase A [Sanguibacter sp. HDW7]